MPLPLPLVVAFTGLVAALSFTARPLLLPSLRLRALGVQAVARPLLLLGRRVLGPPRGARDLPHDHPPALAGRRPFAPPGAQRLLAVTVAQRGGVKVRPRPVIAHVLVRVPVVAVLPRLVPLVFTRLPP